jgi:multidrug efflux pump subunit AcrB
MGPDPAVLRDIADNVQKVIRANPHMRQVNRDWTQRVPTARFILDQDRLRLIAPSARVVAYPFYSVPESNGDHS